MEKDKEKIVGRPLKYSEETEMLCVRVPKTELESTRELVQQHLTNFQVEPKKVESFPKFVPGKKIIVVGKGGSGKDFLTNYLSSRGFKRNVSYTTRPPREGEVQGEDYRFVKKAYFLLKQKQSFFYETDEFNGWFYGTSLKKWQKNHQLFIMTPAGIGKIKKEDRKDCLIIFLDIDKNTRMDRLLLRSDADSVNRRLAADEADFENFEDYDAHVSDPVFKPEEIEQLVVKFLTKPASEKK